MPLFWSERNISGFLPANTGYVEISIAKWKAILELTLGVFLGLLLIFWVSILFLENPIGQVIPIYDLIPILLLFIFSGVCIYIGVNLLIFPEKAVLSLSHEKLTYKEYKIDWNDIKSINLVRGRALTTVIIECKENLESRSFGITPFYELSSKELNQILNTWKDHFAAAS